MAFGWFAGSDSTPLQREHICGLARFATRRIGSAIDRTQNSIDRTGRMDGNLEVGGVAMLQLVRTAPRTTMKTSRDGAPCR